MKKKKIRLSAYLKPYLLFAIISPLFMVGEVIVDLFQPKLMSRIVNTVVESGDVSAVLQSIVKTGVGMLILVVFGGMMGLLCCYTASVASQGFGNDVRVDAFNKVMSLSQNFSRGNNPLLAYNLSLYLHTFSTIRRSRNMIPAE